MSVLVGFNTRLLVQGMSGSAGAFHAKQMVDYGTQVVAGVVPGKGGTKVAGLEQVRDALHEAYREGKNDPKVKQFGEDVKETFRNIGDEISKLFD